MKSRPIVGHQHEVRAILAGHQTQLRRVVKPQPTRLPLPKNAPDALNCTLGAFVWNEMQRPHESILKLCPYGVVGDQIWVRETYAHLITDQCPWRYKATDDTTMYEWKSSMFMPRAASRIELEITGIRVERVQDISDQDCEAEGIIQSSGMGWAVGEPDNFIGGTRWGAYSHLWKSINSKKHPWSSNPWVWVVEFKRVEVQS